MATAILAAVTILWVGYLLVWSDASWLHPEIVGPATYIWQTPPNNWLLSALRKVFDWKSFDSVNRVRPLNDLFEIFDAIARPYVTLVAGIQGSLNISTVLAGVVTPLFFFGWARRALDNRTIAACLTLILISTTAYLSLIVVYWHPAKKIDVALLCAALYFAERDHQNDRGRNFEWMCASLLGSFFSDELGLGNYVVIAVLYWRSICSSRRRLALYLALPAAFFAGARLIMPLLYLHFGNDGVWSALGDAKKFAVFAYLIDPEFIKAAAIQLARSIMSSVGISHHSTSTEIATLVALVAAPTIYIINSKVTVFKAIVGDRFVGSTFALILFSTYATLLDWYPSPYEISYLGSFNYYYHSPVSVLVLVYLTFGVESFLLIRRQAFFVPATAIIIALNFTVFNQVNELVKMIYFHPRSLDAISDGLRRRDMTTIVPDATDAEAQFESKLKALFGERWKDNGFYRVHRAMVQANAAILPETSLGYLLGIYDPWVKRAN